ncbi:MAG: hypothetical protein Q8L90_05815 [Bacteroidota bacterium]|nr:hypothetical protein [Bacteroidota bacterium]
MKKNICFVFIVISCNCLNAQSACEKGTWIFGISPLQYTIIRNESGTSYIGDTINNKWADSRNGLAIGYNTGIGYFVADNFCLGGGFGLTYAGLGNVPTPSIPTELFARYYLLQKQRCYSFQKENKMMSKSALFIQGTITGGYSDMTNNRKTLNSFSINGNQITREKSYVYGAYISLGYTYLLAKHVAIEANANSFYTVTSNSGTGTYTYNGITSTLPKSKTVFNAYGCYVSIGIQTYF